MDGGQRVRRPKKRKWRLQDARMRAAMEELEASGRSERDDYNFLKAVCSCADSLLARAAADRLEDFPTGYPEDQPGENPPPPSPPARATNYPSQDQPESSPPPSQIQTPPLAPNIYTLDQDQLINSPPILAPTGAHHSHQSRRRQRRRLRMGPSPSVVSAGKETLIRIYCIVVFSPFLKIFDLTGN